jgi:molybdenum cofactor guanylyltransferase
MQAKNSVVGVVIAGGRSLRFGGEKAIAPFAGRPLLLWAAARMAPVCSRVAVNARPESGAAALAAAEGLLLLTDAQADPLGPLSGVKVGLGWAQQQGATLLAVSPCDAPLLPEDLYQRLLAAAGAGAAMAVTVEGRQPLCSIWPVSALPAVTAALDGGAHPPTWSLLEAAGAVKVHFDRAEDFANLNTREDLARLEAVHASTAHQR